MTDAFGARHGRHPVALLLVLIPHILLGILLLRETVKRDSTQASSRLDVVFIAQLSRKVMAPAPKAAPPLQPAKKPAIVAPRIISRPSQRDPAPAATAPEVLEPALAEESKLETNTIDTSALVKMAGKFDKELRKPGENLLSGAEGKSLRQKMDEAFRAAHLAVPLKWYEAARVELWSAENDPAKIYQVKTAFGTYCLFYADRLKNPDAPSQPRVGNCPHRY